jgi:hypothetical protein
VRRVSQGVLRSVSWPIGQRTKANVDGAQESRRSPTERRHERERSIIERSHATESDGDFHHKPPDRRKRLTSKSYRVEQIIELESRKPLCI